LDVRISRVLPLGYEVGIREALTSNSKYESSPIANKYSDGKFKRTLSRELTEPET
jgi:hypothetical protein